MTTLRLRGLSRALGLNPRRRAAAGPAGPPTIVPNGLIAEWRFDEGAGQVVTDHTGNGHDGTLGADSGSSTDDPIWTAQGLTFDGDDFVLCDNAGISGTTALTFVGVMKRGGGNGELAVEWAGTGSPGERLTIKVHGGLDAMFLETAGTVHESALAVPDTSGWHFIAYTQSGANWNTGVLYVDGAAEAVTTSRATNIAGAFRFGFTGGGLHAMAAAYGLVYDRALSPAEIERDRQALSVIVAPRGIVLLP